jgi:hypothetical protein
MTPEEFLAELACRYLGGVRPVPLSDEQWLARLGDASHLRRRDKPLPAAALLRESLYGDRG